MPIPAPCMLAFMTCLTLGVSVQVWRAYPRQHTDRYEPKTAGEGGPTPAHRSETWHLLEGLHQHVGRDEREDGCREAQVAPGAEIAVEARQVPRLQRQVQLQYMNARVAVLQSLSARTAGACSRMYTFSYARCQIVA